ncbi:MAG TPA: transcriptional regulator NrdR [Candidatus Nanoarchaeia archaeon]|nr:transcriptional regulator NrdR [Candidatus Nanoarchaeia archaeon]
MQCPYCTNEETKVVDKRETDSLEVTRRRRECLKCEKRFTTYERVEIDLRVIKKDGRREAFSREKVKNGMLRACEKRPVTTKQIEDAINKIEAALRSRSSDEIKSTIIGELVSKELRKLDKVAYIRFASVYKDFEDIESFAAEVQQLTQLERKR